MALTTDERVAERLYDAACFVTSSSDASVPIHQPLAELGFENFVAAIVGSAAYMKALGLDAGRQSSAPTETK
jgi:hypothetical protein